MTEMRIDKWLWATRIFKTRSLATDQCKLGRVTIKGMNVKPSHNIKVGDVIQVRKPPITFTFEVVGLLNNRVGAKLVPNYLKNITPDDQYRLLEMARIGGFVRRQKGMGRPTKKEGREMKECRRGILRLRRLGRREPPLDRRRRRSTTEKGQRIKYKGRRTKDFVLLKSHIEFIILKVDFTF